MNRNILGRGFGLTIVVIGLSGCAASMERPVQQLARAEASVEQAQRADARRYSAVELDSARDKLRKAQEAADNNQFETAEFLAHEAELEAELAAAKASTKKSEKAVQELERSIETLQSEIKRNQAP